MKQRYNRLKIAALGLSVTMVAFTSLVPAAASALDGHVQKGAATAASTPKASPFCANLPNTISTLTTKVAAATGKLTQAQTTRDRQLVADRVKWDQEIASNRAHWDQQRQANFVKLETKASSSSQSAAVKAYESTIITGISVRRAANDQARATYRAAVDSTIASHRSTINNQLTAFTASVTNAETTAQASCQATPNQGPALRTTFQAALKSARETYTADRKSDNGLTAQLKQLAQTRDASFQANNAAFSATAKTAQAALKTAFGTVKV